MRRIVQRRIVRAELSCAELSGHRQGIAVKVGVVYFDRVDDQMNQGKSFLRDDILVLSGRPVGDGYTCRSQMKMMSCDWQ